MSGKSTTEVHAEIRSSRDEVTCTLDGRVGGRVTINASTQPQPPPTTLSTPSSQPLHETPSGAALTTTNRTSSSSFDLNTQRRAKKRVRAFDQLDSYESRRVWAQACDALRRGDLIAASAHKQYIEKQQRNTTPNAQTNPTESNNNGNKLANIGTSCRYFARVGVKSSRQVAPVLNASPDDELASQFKWIFKNFN